MVKGSCLCGDFAYQFTGEPAATVACHCHPCRKTSGTTGSYNLMIPASAFSVTRGISKQFTRTGDSGGDVTYHSCPICGTLLFVEAAALADVKIVKMGSVDDAAFVDGLGPPETEIYCRNLSIWEEGWDGAKKAQGAQ